MELLVAQNNKARKEPMNQGEDEKKNAQGKAVAMEIGCEHESHRYRRKI